MPKEPWLPRGFELPDGSEAGRLRFSGGDWQVFDTTGTCNLLLVSSDLARQWNDANLFAAAILGEVVFGSGSYRSLLSNKKFALAPVGSGESPSTKVDALAFAIALKETRRLSNDTSFHDAIYVEQYSRLLPTWTLTPRTDDEVVLGLWLTGGVEISTRSFRRLTNLMGWMPPEALVEIIQAAGLEVPDNAPVLAKRSSGPRPETTVQSAVAGMDVESDAESDSSIAEPKLFSLPGRPKLEAFFNEYIVDIILSPAKYQEMGIEFPSATVLYGPPGCGKTFAVERFIEFIDWPSFSIDSNSVGSPYIHETSKKISQVFEKAIDSAPSVLVVDEMESFLSDRQSGGTSGLHHVEEVAEFLRRIPEAIESQVLIIAMTNLIDLIDPAILRRGRFDHVIEVGMPSRVEVRSLLDSLFSKLPQAADVDMEELLDTLTGRALSDSAFVAREAARLAAKEGKSQIDQESLLSALESLPRSNEKRSRQIGFTQDS